MENTVKGKGTQRTAETLHADLRSNKIDVAVFGRKPTDHYRVKRNSSEEEVVIRRQAVTQLAEWLLYDQSMNSNLLVKSMTTECVRW